MRPSQRIALVDRIGRILQERYSYRDIDVYLSDFGVAAPKDITVNSKWIYVKEALSQVPINVLSDIAHDLEISSAGLAHSEPRNWKGTKSFRLFVSHISKDKIKATRLRDTLSPYAISAFVAHEDIHPTVEWQQEIERALFTMDGFLAIHTRGFSTSNWTQQEVGFAVARDVKIISLRMGEDPTGFISRLQALPRLNRTAEEIASEVDALLLADPRTKSRLEAAKQALAPVTDNEIPF
jgi:TIR domain